MLLFEWDEVKSAGNLAKHGISFAAARMVFDDVFAIDMEDRSMAYGEVRRRIIGLGDGVILTVAYTERGEGIRIISARKATRMERRYYENQSW